MSWQYLESLLTKIFTFDALFIRFNRVRCSLVCKVSVVPSIITSCRCSKRTKGEFVMRLIMLFCYSGKPVFIVYVENKHVLGVLSIELLVYIVNTKLQTSSLFCRLLIKLMFELRSYKSLYSNFQPFTLKVPYLLP